jgi:SAM-dependent methyltransferase
VTAIDISPEMIRRARAHGAERGIDVEWRVGDLAALADPDDHYDAVMARVCLQFVPDPLGALQEFKRVLRPGGRLFVSTPGALSPIFQDSWRRFVAPDEVITNGLVPWELETLLTGEGWTIVEGWGEYGQDLSGRQNPLSAEDVAAFDVRLQQAAASIWTFIASNGPPAAAS